MRHFWDFSQLIASSKTSSSLYNLEWSKILLFMRVFVFSDILLTYEKTKRLKIEYLKNPKKLRKFKIIFRYVLDKFRSLRRYARSLKIWTVYQWSTRQKFRSNAKKSPFSFKKFHLCSYKICIKNRLKNILFAHVTKMDLIGFSIRSFMKKFTDFTCQYFHAISSLLTNCAKIFCLKQVRASKCILNKLLLLLLLVRLF